MKITVKKITLSLVSLVACCAGISAALGGKDAYQTSPALLKEFKIHPVGRVWGVTGSRTTGMAQVLVPIYGNQNNLLYAIAEGNKSLSQNRDWYAGGGFGYRKVINDSIYGGYLVGDYNRSVSSGYGYWVMNPGVEFLGKQWEASINGYFPVTRSRNTLTETKWADQFGDYEYVKHTGHVKINRRAERDSTEFVGRGFDFRVGRVVPHFEKAKVYLGGYFFNVGDAGSVNGGLAKVTYDINKYAAVELTQTYDRQNRGRTFVGLRLTAGGYDKADAANFGVSSRLLDPIDRGYGSTITPIGEVYGVVRPIGNDEQEDGNLQWVKPPADSKAGTADTGNPQLQPKILNGDGSYENPYDAFNPDTIASIKNHVDPKFPYPTLMFYAKGEYALSEFGSNSTLTLPYGWGMYGAGVDTRMPAVGDERPVFIGALRLDNTSGNNTLDSIILKNDPDASSRSGINIIDAPGVNVLRNVKVGAGEAESGVGGYARGIFIQGSTLNFEQQDELNGGGVTEVNGYCSGYYPDCLNNSGGLTLDDSAVVNFVSGTNNIAGYTAQNSSASMGRTNGIVMSSYSGKMPVVVNIIGGKNTISAKTVFSNGAASTEGTAIGIDAQNEMATLNITGGENVVTAHSLGITGSSNIYGFGIRSNEGTVNLNGGINTISGTAEAIDMVGGTVNASGLSMIQNSRVNIGTSGSDVNNTINATARTNLNPGYFPIATGLQFKKGASELTIGGGNTTVNVNGSAGGVGGGLYGMMIDDESKVRFLGGTMAVRIINSGTAEMVMNGIEAGVVASFWNGSEEMNINSFREPLKLKTVLSFVKNGLTDNESRKVVWGDDFIRWGEKTTELTAGQRQSLWNDYLVW